MTSYDGLPDVEQVAVLTDVASTAAPRFGLQRAPVELVAHAYNTTFAATGPRGRSSDRVALRVHTNSHSTPEHVRAQHAWIRHLAHAGVAVPEPQRTTDGVDLTEVDHAGRRWTVTAAAWLDGPDLDGFDVESARRLGRLTARMHDLADGFTVPEGAALPTYDEPLFGDPDHLSTWSGSGREVLVDALERTRSTYRRLTADRRLVPCHADLHAANLKEVGDDLAVLDFDDMGLTVPAVDLATTVFHVREQPGSAEVEGALLAGYGDTRPLPPGATGPDLEALVASRQLLLTNSLLSSTTGSMRAAAAEHLEETVTRLRTWLTTDRFEIHPPA